MSTPSDFIAVVNPQSGTRHIVPKEQTPRGFGSLGECLCGTTRWRDPQARVWTINCGNQVREWDGGTRAVAKRCAERYLRKVSQ